ncbi:hybrid sensor histidine kinase/response regulator [Lacibacter luteus]|uniref:histidine kinase n=1 Tax=Lacibacter luteus TaxID=2508719 RepID=A0A4V1M7P8_9BACT|nr:hybrid sensor histidine kinase/response regulator transcription factor [Lacibacter luteus]RXK60825.1 hybrid sensor histidine kinase/response regulator [Lacibacter luteus]
MPQHLLFTKLLLILLGIWFVMPVSGQLKYEQLTTSEGLSQGYVYDILQDKDGFMWFGTKDGLNRYDGYSFKVYTHDSYNPYSISNNNVNRLFEDSKGRLWVLTDDGINIYDKKRDQFRRILHDPKNANSLSGNKVFVPVIELPDGRFLVFPQEKTLNVISLPADFLEKNTQPVITHLSAPGAGNVSCMYMDGRKKVWIISDKVYELLPNDLSLIWRKNSFSFGQTAPAPDGSVWADDFFFSQVQDTVMYPLFSKDIVKGHGRVFLHEADKKRFWLGITDSGRLEIFDTKNWKRGSPLDPEQTRLHGFSQLTPTKIYKDRSGLVWLGTNGYGVRKYSNDTEKFHHIANGLSVRTIMDLPNNQVFVRGWGELQKFDTNGKNLTGKEEKILFNGSDFFMGKEFTIWGLRRKNGYRDDNFDKVVEKLNLVTKISTTYRINVSREEELVESKMEDSKGHIWLMGLGGRLIVLNPHTGAYKKISIANAANSMLQGAQITALHEDASGVFWAGTESGLARINFQFNADAPPKITWYKTNAADKTALNYSHVSCMIDDAFDNAILWVATKGGGLNRLNKTTNQFTHITTKEGLCNNVVYGLLTDDAGNIWGSTNNGIFCLLNNNKEKQGKWLFRHFTKSSGLQDDEFNTGAFTKLSNGDLAFGGVNGINIFNPVTVLQTGYTPNVFITNILAGNETVLPNDKTGILEEAIEQSSSITLNHLQDILTLEFSSLDFTAPAQNKYRYQLVGIDKDWVESGTRRTATYLHLPPGNYTFKLQGSNSQGMWSGSVKELKITVKPPWWRTWWAYVLYALLIGFAVRSYIVFRINKTKLRSQLHYEQQEAKRIKELDTLKTQLYANITHEFRTPLTVIMGMAQQVKTDPEEHLGNGMDMIVRNGQHLLNLVNEMLDLSKLEDGKMTLHLVNGDVINFLRYIVESFQSLAAGQQKQFHFLSDTDELTVAYDAEKLRQIITNLLSNALKFTTAHGNVYVSISQEPAAEGYTTLLLKVKDTGIGIPENQLQHIFDRFYQLDNSHTRKAEGTGIGLALTKELVKLMNGTIAVKSPPVGATKGTEFTITLPLKKVHAEEVAATIPAFIKEPVVVTDAIRKEPVIINNEHTAAGTPLILLVEDNVDVVAYTASCLPNYKLAVGKDGKEGFDIAVEIIPDLIITDVMMPFIDGFEMCRRLRADERTSHIPIIMLTAKADMQSKLEGLDKGADVYLEKPFHKEELLLRIKKLLELRKNLQQYYSRQMGIADKAEAASTEEIAIIPEEKAEHAFVKKVRELVEANFTNYEFSVEQLCKLIFMSHSQLHRKLEALTGCSPNKFIRIIRLNKAKELLADPSLSIAGIALDCGYNDPGYFARVFKQEFGVTPQEWRAEVKK